MKNICALFFIMMVLADSAASQPEEPRSDLIEYIDQIKAWGMTEAARASIGMIADYRIGGATLSFHKDEKTGEYFIAIRGTKCFSPDRDPEQVERERERHEYQRDCEIIKLRPLADADGSGFVTTSEGKRFRSLVEFGYKAAHVISMEGADTEGCLQGLMMSEDEFREILAKYGELSIRAEKAGIEGFPEVPSD
jgi:hypothetical protein